jgi:tellurite methyltransferase
MTISQQQSDRERWDERYATLEPERKRTPTPFVAACLTHLPQRGYALDVAAGNGRNSVLLAQHGLQVDALDISWHGLRKALEQAAEKQVALNAVVVDLKRGWLPPRQYDVVVNSYFLLRELIPTIKAAVKPGGWVVFETFTRHQLKLTPHRFTTDKHLLASGEAPDLFADFDVVHYWEGEEGDKATARLLVRKRFC